MPIKGHCRHPNRKTLDHHSEISTFFRKVFVTTHVRGNLRKHERENFGVQQPPTDERGLFSNKAEGSSYTSRDVREDQG